MMRNKNLLLYLFFNCRKKRDLCIPGHFRYSEDICVLLLACQAT